MHVRPIVLGAQLTPEVCLHCGARAQSVCSAIADADLAQLARAAVEIEVEKGRCFIEEGSPATDFYNVTSGTVKLFKLLPDGRQQITGFAGVGHFLGLAVTRTYAFSAEAIEPVRLCRFTRAKLHHLLDDVPAMERRLLETACNELATAQEQMLLLGRKTALERVATFLVNRSRLTPCGPGDRIHLPMTRGEIADYLGLTIETVSRTFSRLKADKRIRLDTVDTVVLLDRAWLEEQASN